MMTYTSEQLDKMRVDCCTAELKASNENNHTWQILYGGTVGWRNIPEDKLIENWELWFGKEADDDC